VAVTETYTVLTHIVYYLIERTTTKHFERETQIRESKKSRKQMAE
jgi:hypothetical protein